MTGLRALMVVAVIVLVPLGCAGIPDSERGRSIVKSDLLADLKTRSLDDNGAQDALSVLCSNFSLSSEEFADTKRFLKSSSDVVFSAAIECLARTDSPEAGDHLKSLVGSTNLFRAFRAAQVLNRLGDTSGVMGIATRIARAQDALDSRRDVVWRVLAERPRDLARPYVEMLRDREKWIRYGAVCALRWYSHESLGYDYRSPGEASIEAWKRWVEANQSRLPEAFEPEAGVPSGVVGIELSPSSQTPVVVGVEAESPADKVVRTGDELVSIDGDSVAGKTSLELSLCELRGVPGSRVRLLLKRGPETLEVGVVRVDIGRLQSGRAE